MDEDTRAGTTGRRHHVVDAPRAARAGFLALLPLLAACAPSYKDVSQQLFVPRCATTYCHSGGESAAGALPLTEDEGFAALVGVPVRGVDWAQTPYAGFNRVEPGDPDRSALLVSLRRPDDLPLRYRMPTGGEHVSDAELDLVWRWVAAGAPR